MIDLHCHILLGIGEVVKRHEDFLAVDRWAVAEVITHSFVTPHYKNGLWANEKDVINQLFKILQQELRNVGELVEGISSIKYNLLMKTATIY